MLTDHYETFRFRWTAGAIMALSLLFSHVSVGSGPGEAGRSLGQAMEVTVADGETLSDIALRTLGDSNAAVEIRAFNGLSADAVVSPGTKVRIPSRSDRKFALSAIENVENALNQLKHVGVPSNMKAEETRMSDLLEQARASLAAARYQAVIESGDAAMSIANALFDNLAVRTVFDVEVRSGSDPADDTSVFSVHKGKLKIDTPANSAVLDAGQAGKVEAKTGKIAVADLPDPPVIDAPAEGVVFYDYNLGLAWTPPVPEMREFLLEIAGDVRFSRVEVETIVKGLRAHITEPLVDGTHYWRVACLTADGISGKWSDHRSFIMLYDREPPEVKIYRPIWK